jgi:hypothetical protein
MDMIDFGFEHETTELDEYGSTLSLIKVIRKGEVVKSYKQYSNRVKVRDHKEEMAEYIRHTDRLKEKKESGQLVTHKPELTPAFIVEYPKFDIDGSYFVVSSWAEFI